MERLILANSDDLIGELYRIRTCDTLIRSNAAIFQGFGLFQIMRAWINHGGFLAIKVSGAFLATLLLWIKYNAKPRPVYAITVAFLVFYTIIVFWNLFVFFVTV